MEQGPFDDIDDFFLEEKKLEKQTADVMASLSVSQTTTPASTAPRKVPGAPRKPRATASTSRGGASTVRPLGQVRRKLTPPNSTPTTQIQKIDLAEPLPTTISFKHHQTPLKQITEGSKDMGYYQLVTDTGAPAVFFLSQVNHYGLKHDDRFDRFRFPVCGLELTQRHGLNSIQNIFEGRVDYEKTF